MAEADPRPVFLLTGFGPFPGVRKNASIDLVKALARQARRERPEFRFVVAVLPTEWARGPQRVHALHAKHSPVAALHFGVAAGTRGLRIESQAANRCRRSKDAAGAWPLALHVAKSGEAIRSSTLNAGEIAETLKAKDFPVEVSDDAGGYLCNATFYQSLLTSSRSSKPCPVGFIHIPADLSQPPLTLERAVSGALEIIKIVITEQKAALLTSV